VGIVEIGAAQVAFFRFGPFKFGQGVGFVGVVLVADKNGFSGMTAEPVAGVSGSAVLLIVTTTGPGSLAYTSSNWTKPSDRAWNQSATAVTLPLFGNRSA